MAHEIPFIADEELAQETQEGSLDAFEQLVCRYERRVHAFVSQFCRNATDACEITQDTFVTAFQKIAQFDSRRTFAAWLFTIARRKCIDRHRAAHQVADDSIPALADHIDPSELLARREEGRNLWQFARERLGETQFQAVWLHYAEDMNVTQIAQVLGKTRVHIKVILFRARRVLGRELNPGRTLSQAISVVNLTPALAACAGRKSSLPPAK